MNNKTPYVSEDDAFLVFDIETDGLLDELTKVHMLVATDVKSGRRYVNLGMSQVEAFLKGPLSDTTYVPTGHNILAFDIPALQKLFPWWAPVRPVLDTLVCARVQEPRDTLFDADLKRVKKGKFPKSLIAAHSLEAYGYRLGNYKGDFKGPWREQDLPEGYSVKAWLDDMLQYCIQDVSVTCSLLNNFKPWEYSQEAISLEHDVQRIIQRQVRRGVCFDVEAAQLLRADLMIRRDELTQTLKGLFEGWYAADGKPWAPKRDSKSSGYTAGALIQKIKWVEFSPSSRHHIARVLTHKYGWQPAAFTESGQPQVNELVLQGLKEHPGVPELLEYLLVDKRLGQLYEGENGWLKMVAADGRIHGNVNSNGAVTGRMTHSSPNLAQVPAAGSPYGKECRALFYASGALVGVDASGLEGRTLAHYTSRYDGGAYGKLLLEGDVHWENTQALGLVPAGALRDKTDKSTEALRDTAKTWFYAWMYGAGDKKLAVTLGCSESKAQSLREAFLRNAASLGKLQDDIAKAIAANGHLKGIDGRILHVRSAHSALNTLLQSCGAIVMKRALVTLDKNLQILGLVPGFDYEFVLNVHDEFQIEARPEKAELIAQTACKAIEEAGRYYKLRVPMAGDYKIGKTWADTH